MFPFTGNRTQASKCPRSNVQIAVTGRVEPLLRAWCLWQTQGTVSNSAAERTWVHSQTLLSKQYMCKINYLERALSAPDTWLMQAEWLPFKVYSQENGAGGSHATDRDTQVIPEVTVYGLHFVQHGFWLCGFQTQTLIHLTALNLSLFVHIYILLVFLTVTSMPSLNIIVQEWERKQTLHMIRAGQGMLVWAVCFLHSGYSYQSSTGYLKPNYSNKDPVVFLDGCLHPPTWALYIGHKN